MDRDRGVLEISGQLTLEEVEYVTGISPNEIIEALRLPSRTPHDETLGQLRKKYGFNMVEFREILTGLMNRPLPEHETGLPPGEQRLQERKIPQKKEEKHEEAHKPQWREAEETSGMLITGRMTLRELEKQTGLSGRAIADRLGLPGSVSLDERLGLLRRRHAFTLQEVRDIVAVFLRK